MYLDFGPKLINGSTNAYFHIKLELLSSEFTKMNANFHNKFKCFKKKRKKKDL